MSKKSTTKRNQHKTVRSPVATVVAATTTVCELSYDEMLSELEAIVSEAGVRLAEEEASL